MALHAYQFNFRQVKACVTTWRKPRRRWTEKKMQSYHIVLSSDEPCWQACAARGRPRLSCREEHRNAPVELAAAQTGPWHRPANYRPSSCIQHPRERPSQRTYQGNPKRTNKLGWVSRAAPQKETIKPAQKTERRWPARAGTIRMS